MNYKEHIPHKTLQSFVDVFWVLEGPFEENTERVLPDGRTEFVVHYGDPFEISYDGQNFEQQSNVIFAAQIENSIYLRSTGRIGMIGARFKPHLARCFFCYSIEAIAGKVHNVTTIPGLRANELQAQIASANKDIDRIAALEVFLLAQLDAKKADGLVGEIVDSIQECGGTGSLLALARDQNISLRQLERRFGANVGLSPKKFARIVRFQKVLEFCGKSDGKKLLDVALSAGYFDQSHFIKEFSKLAGASPRKFFQERHPLSDFFVGID